MSDQLHYADGNLQIFEWWGLNDPLLGNRAEPFQKSWVRNCTFLDIFMVGAGSGGGAGRIKAAGVAGGGGGGGAAGGILTARFPLAMLPETWYFLLPLGSFGGNGTAGTPDADAAIPAYMLMKPVNFSSADILLISSAAQPGGGAQGGAASGGAGGSANTAAVNTTGIGANITFAWFPRVGGTGGGGAAAGVGNAPGQSSVVCGGAGGAGSSTVADFAGGNIPAFGQVPAIVGGAAGAGGNGGNGGGGLWLRDNPFSAWIATGGAGGGSTNTAATVGGRGGDGAPGCGGGGGGAGPTGGIGGTGGPAYLYMVAS